MQVGSRVTRYVRAGRGRTVLLISEEGRHPPSADSLLMALAGSFRVIAATAPEEGSAPVWLRGLLEGLGVERPHLVVRGRGTWVEEACRELGGEVDRVVLVDLGVPAAHQVARLLTRDR